MTHDIGRLTAKNRDQLRNSELGNRVLATFTLFYTFVTFIPTHDRRCPGTDGEIVPFDQCVCEKPHTLILLTVRYPE